MYLLVEAYLRRRFGRGRVGSRRGRSSWADLTSRRRRADTLRCSVSTDPADTSDRQRPMRTWGQTRTGRQLRLARTRLATRDGYILVTCLRT